MRRVLLLGALISACHSTTEIVVVVRSDLSADQLQSVRLFAASYVSPCTPVGPGHASLPLSFGLEAGSHPEKSFVVRVSGYSSDNCDDSTFTAEQSATLSFVSGHRQELELDLLQACAGVQCTDPHQTCYDASRNCVDNTMNMLPGFSPDSLAPAPDLGGSGGSDGGGPSLCPGGLAFCDGFEDGTLANWDVTSSKATLPVVDTSRAYRGTHALHMSVSGQGSTSAYPSQTLEVGLAASPVYIRAFLYLKSGFQESNLLWVGDNLGNFCGVDIGGNVLVLDTNDQPAFPLVISTAAPRRDTWICLEMFYDEAAHEIRVWLDDTEITSLHATGWTGSGLDQMSLHASTQSPGGPDVEVWYDEVAMDGQRIGCTR